MSTPVLAGKKMSASLRERLKKIRGHNSTPQAKHKQEDLASPVSSEEPLHKDSSFRKDVALPDDRSSPDFELSEKDDVNCEVNELPFTKYSESSPVMLMDTLDDDLLQAKQVHVKETAQPQISHRKRLAPKFNKLQTPKRHISDSFIGNENESNCKVLVTEATEKKSRSSPKVISFKSNKLDASKSNKPNRTVKSTEETEDEKDNRKLVKDDTCDENDAVDEQQSLSKTSGKLTVLYDKSQLGKLSDTELQTIKKSMMKEAAEKEEILRKLKMVKVYRSKNNLKELEGVITKWREVCHNALTELQSLAAEHRPTMSQLVQHFNLDAELLQLNEVEEEDCCA